MTDVQVPFSDLIVTEQDVEAVTEALRSGWLTQGPLTAQFEEQFARFVGAKHAVAVSSGTAALHLACLAAGIRPGDEVVVPSVTFVATVSAVAATGATPVFADSGAEGTPWPTVESVERLVTERTRAIMAMSYGGHPSAIPELADFAAGARLTLLEDAAHAVGSRVNGRHLGTFGIAGAFSFHSNKNVPIGEAGMVVTDDLRVADRVRSLRQWGVTQMQPRPGEGRPSDYDVDMLGFNYRMDEPRAALGISRLARAPAENRARGEIERRYLRALEPVGVVPVLAPPGPQEDRSHHLFPILLPPEADRDAFRSALAARGVESSVHYPPVHRFSYYGQSGAKLPNAEDFSARTVSLPLFPHLSPQQFDVVLNAVKAATGDW